MQLLTIPHSGAAAADVKDYVLLKDLNILAQSDGDVSKKLTYDELARISFMIFVAGNAAEKTDFYTEAASAGLIPADAQGNVSSDEAVKAILRAVGLKTTDAAVEEKLFGFDIRQEMLRGVTVADSTAITLGEACAITENALKASSITFDGTEFKTGKKTVLEERFGLTIVDGVLFTGEMNGLSDAILTIDGKVYGASKDFSDFAGYKVRAYADENDNVISVDASSFRNEIYVISANDIEEIGQNSISFLNANGKKIKKQIADDAAEVYNGRLCTLKITDFDISNGYITLIRHQSESEYSVALIKQYDILVAGGFANGIVYDYNGTGSSVKLNDSNVKVTMTMNGEPASEADIQKYDVLLLSYTKDREKLDIEIVRNTVSGTVTEMDDDVIKIGRRNYIKTAYFKQYAKEVMVGKEVELILDNAGLAVGFRQGVSTSEKYGYFMGLFPNEAGDKCRIKLLTEDGSVEVLDLCDRITLNGAYIKNVSPDNTVLVNTFKTLVECTTDGVKSQRQVNDYVYQLIIYSTDSSGTIRYIDTAIEETDKERENQLTLDGYVNANKRFKSDPLQFADSFGLAADRTKVFYVPLTDNVFDEYGNLDTAQRELANNEDYTIETTGFLQNDEDDAVVHAYCVSKGGVADAVIIYNQDLVAGKEFTDLTAGLFILTEISTGLNDEDEVCYVLKGDLRGTPTTYYMEKEDFGQEIDGVFVEPEVGDILQVKADAQNNVLSYAIRYSGTKNINYSTTGNNIWSKFGNYAGFVYDQDENGIVTVSSLDTLENKRIAMKKSIY